MYSFKTVILTAKIFYYIYFISMLVSEQEDQFHA